MDPGQIPEKQAQKSHPLKLKHDTVQSSSLKGVHGHSLSTTYEGGRPFKDLNTNSASLYWIL